MRRAALLLLCVVTLMAQKADGPTARASVCQDRQCRTSSQSGYAPALIRVSYFVPLNAENRAAQFGLSCTEHESLSAWQLDGDQEKMPSWLVMYRDVPAGECRALIIVVKRDGSQQVGRSGIVRVLGRD